MKSLRKMKLRNMDSLEFETLTHICIYLCGHVSMIYSFVEPI